ncbi:hypothetical protein WA026_005887 [Henosepilachna vigintioctopunctata]|uniref:Uncharacterized protein n=1 Tax=Henosepilachna vigintioctopunctata TaxID=420089 RepID=A0AAW1U362_9CUCU
MFFQEPHSSNYPFMVKTVPVIEQIHVVHQTHLHFTEKSKVEDEEWKEGNYLSFPLTSECESNTSRLFNELKLNDWYAGKTEEAWA